jgi:hypothetical protein
MVWVYFKFRLHPKLLKANGDGPLSCHPPDNYFLALKLHRLKRLSFIGRDVTGRLRFFFQHRGLPIIYTGRHDKMGYLVQASQYIAYTVRTYTHAPIFNLILTDICYS